MLNFLLGNKYLAIAKWIGIAIAVWYIFHTWDKAQNYDSVKAQLTAEQNCSPQSSCAVRVFNDAKEAQDAIQKAQQEAASANIIAEEARNKAAQKEAEKNAAEVQKYNAELAAILAKHTLSCDEWSKQVNPCDMQ